MMAKNLYHILLFTEWGVCNRPVRILFRLWKLLWGTSLDFEKDRGMVEGSIFRRLRIFGFKHASPLDKKKPLVEARVDPDTAAKATMAQILNSIPQSVSWKDKEGVFLGCNEVFAHAFGLERPEDIIGKTDYDLPWSRADADTYCADDQAVMKSAKAKKHIIEPLQLADCPRLWIDISKIPLYDAQGKITGILGIFDDITERVKIESALRESEEQYRQVVQSSPMGMHMYELRDHDRLVFVGANPAADKILGVDNAQFIGRTLEEAFPPLANTEIPFRYRMAAAEGIPWQNEELVFKHGSIHGAYEVFAFQTGKNRVTVNFLDITHRKKTEEEREKAWALLEAAVAQSPAGILIADAPNATIRMANAAMVGADSTSNKILTDSDMAQVPSLRRIYKPEGMPYSLEEMPLFRAILKGEITNNEEILVRYPQGEERWELANAAPVRNRQGEITAGIVILQDITALKKTEQSLRESEKKFKELAELLPETVYECDLRGRMVYANQVALTKFGYTPEDLKQGINVIDTLAPQERERAGTAFRLLLEGKLNTPSEYLAQRTDGTTFPVLIYSSFVEAQGKIVGLRGIIIDLTLMKQLESERLNLERQMQQTQKLESLGVLAGGIAHDFNNILASILGNASLGLEELPPFAPGRESLEAIEGSARRAAELCRQMLAYSGKGRFLIEPLRLDELVTGLSPLLKTSISKRATLILQSEKGTAQIFGDSTQIQQIVMNLVINASESLGDQPGFIKVSTGDMECSRDYLQSGLYQESDLQPGRFVWLSVSDTGCGMNPETQRRIFEPFYTSKFTGRGLGLSAVLGIVRGHKGALYLESQPGKGSTFRILFPAAQEETLPTKATQAPSDFWTGHGCMLLVEDELDVRILEQKMLERLGFEVMPASNGIEALEIYRQNPGKFTMVLLDLTMPYMNGQEMFHELCKINPAVKVLISSGYSESEVASRFAGEQIAGFIEKPFTLDELRERLRENL
jgi:two-component system cell cycle sensor histidine kinase/response regulator CckA